MFEPLSRQAATTRVPTSAAYSAAETPCADQPLRRERDSDAECHRDRRREEPTYPRHVRGVPRVEPERPPVVAHVRHDRRQCADEYQRHRYPSVSPRGPSTEGQPRERRHDDRHDLWRLPCTQSEGEPEKRGVAPRTTLCETKNEQEYERSEDKPRAVEPVRAGRLPHEVGRPNQEDRAGDGRGRLADRSAADPPDEDGGYRREDDRNHSDRPDTRRHGNERHAEQNLQCPPIPLTPVEGAHVSFEYVTRHQAPHRLVRVQDAERRGVDEDAQNQASDGRNGDDAPGPRRVRSSRTSSPVFASARVPAGLRRRDGPRRTSA